MAFHNKDGQIYTVREQTEVTMQNRGIEEKDLDSLRLGAWGRSITDGNRQRDAASIDLQDLFRRVDMCGVMSAKKKKAPVFSRAARRSGLKSLIDKKPFRCYYNGEIKRVPPADG